MKNHLMCVCIVVFGAMLGYAIGNSTSTQSCQVKQICQCDEDCNVALPVPVLMENEYYE